MGGVSNPPQLGTLLAASSIDTTFTQTGAGNSDVTGLSISPVIGSRPVVVSFDADACANSSASGIGQWRIMEGSTVLAVSTLTLTAISFQLHRETPPLSLSPGVHTFKINIIQLVTGNSSIVAGANDKAVISCVEV